MSAESAIRALRGVGKGSIALLFSGLDLDDRFARAERFDDHPGCLTRLRMLQLAGVEQELASVIGSLALEAAYAGGDARLRTLAVAQERLSAAWSKLSDPAMERLFDATPLWALSRPEEKFELNPAFWRVLGPPTTPAANVDLIRRHLLEKALVVAEHADPRRRAFVAAWLDKGGVSPLVGSANSRLSEALMNTIRYTLGPESFERIAEPVKSTHRRPSGSRRSRGGTGQEAVHSGTSVSREIQALVSVSRFCPSPRSRPPYDVHKRLRGSASISFGVAQRVVTTLRKREVGLAKQPRFDARRSD